MNIRSYVPKTDFAAVFALDKLINPDEAEEIFRKDTENSKAVVLVAEESQKIIGFISISFPYWDRVSMTHHLVVSPDFYSSSSISRLLWGG